jgi:hypothetical protein
MVQELRSLEVGKGVSSGQIKLFGQFWTLRPVANEIWKDSGYEDPRNFINFLQRGKTLNSDLE